jgi:Zn-dependent peptidase ImmA (M78 family)/transcriptional regulator with XRE-family HTH domain
MTHIRTEALVEPDVLRWARETAGLSPEEAAHSLQISDKKIHAWESGDKRPSMPQLRKMATVYKRLLSDFYLPAPPPENPLPHDFRRSPSEGVFRYSRPLRYQLRQAQQRRELALDLAAELEVEFSGLPLLQTGEDTEQLSGTVREFLRVPLTEQRTWRDPRKSYNGWRSRIEAAGVLVFQVTGVAPAEMLGFSLTEQPLPVVGVNRKLKPNGRTFTLLHEFVHILLRQSGLCDIEEDFLRPPQEERTEIFCNAVAAAALVPRDALLAEPLVAPHSGPREWSDEELAVLARSFGVSQHVILRRLLTVRRTTQAFYASRQAIWRVYEPPAAPDESSDDDFRRNMPQEVVSDLGRPFTRLILDSYLNSNLSLSDVSRYLGLRAAQVSKVRELVLGS